MRKEAFYSFGSRFDWGKKKAKSIIPRFHVEIILPLISPKPGENFG